MEQKEELNELYELIIHLLDEAHDADVEFYFYMCEQIQDHGFDCLLNLHNGRMAKDGIFIRDHTHGLSANREKIFQRRRTHTGGNQDHARRNADSFSRSQINANGKGGKMTMNRHVEDQSSIARLAMVCLRAGWHMRELEDGDLPWSEDYYELEELLKDAIAQCVDEHGNMAKSKAILVAAAVDDQLECRV